jgi:hypothetical protein
MGIGWSIRKPFERGSFKKGPKQEIKPGKGKGKPPPPPPRTPPEGSGRSKKKIKEELERTPSFEKKLQAKREADIKSKMAKDREARIQALIKKHKNRTGSVKNEVTGWNNKIKEGSGGIKRLDRKSQSLVNKDMANYKKQGKSTESHGPLPLSKKAVGSVDRYLNKRDEGNERERMEYHQPRQFERNQMRHKEDNETHRAAKKHGSQAAYRLIKKKRKETYKPKYESVTEGSGGLAKLSRRSYSLFKRGKSLDANSNRMMDKKLDGANRKNQAYDEPVKFLKRQFNHSGSRWKKTKGR